MGLYYAAVDNKQKKYFESPGKFSIKYPGICHPNNPFPHMVVMKNAQGYNYVIENDGNCECYYSKDYEDVTEQVYEEYVRLFKEVIDDYHN